MYERAAIPDSAFFPFGRFDASRSCARDVCVGEVARLGGTQGPEAEGRLSGHDMVGESVCMSTSLEVSESDMVELETEVSQDRTTTKINRRGCRK